MMRIKSGVFGVVVVLLLAWSGAGFAQYTEDYQTNVISGVTSNWTGDYYVGNTNVGDLLLIEKGGVLDVSSSSYGYIGSSSGASNNSVLITGSGSLWNIPMVLKIGGGSGNSLVVSNGGGLKSAWGYVGILNSSVSNTVTITGSGSVWTNMGGTLEIGQFGGPGNGLIITNGGRVVNQGEGYIGRWQFGSHSRAVVTGDGSLWTNTLHLTVGLYAPFNTLIISNGGRVVNDAGYLGRSQSTATNNNVVVTDSNSTWVVRSGLNIGPAAGGNSLTVSNGGTVISTTATLSSSGNRVLVSDPGSIWTNSTVIVNGIGNSLTVSNGGSLYGVVYLGFQSGSRSNRFEVSGTGCFIGAGFIVGTVSSDNEMVLTNGTTVTSLNASIGYDAQAIGNKLVLTGSNTTLSLSYGSISLYLGTYGKSNGLVVADGARFEHNWMSAGYFAGANNNWILVTGASSVFSNRNGLVLGQDGADCWMTISNGAAVYDLNGTVGSGLTASNNVATVTGSNTVWHNFGTLIVGSSGDTNTLFVRDSGTVFANNVVVGANAGADGNRIVIEGGLLVATNAGGNGIVELRRGTMTMAGGILTANNLSVSNDATLTGYGTINGSVLVSGTVVTDGILSFNGAVTNNGILNLIHGGAIFHSAFVNNGIVLMPDEDTDGDGMTNLQEDEAGTDPLDSRSRLAVSDVAVAGDDVLVTWQAVGGKRYIVQTNATPSGIGFADSGSVISIPGSSSTTTNYLDIGGATKVPSRFYRVRLVP